MKRVQNQEVLFDKKYVLTQGDLQDLYLDVFMKKNLDRTFKYPRPLSHTTESKTLESLFVHRKNHIVLDVGCGKGASFLPFLSKVKRIDGIDFARSGLDAGRKIFSAFVRKGLVTFSRKNFFDIGKSSGYTLVSMITVLEHFRSYAEAQKAISHAYTLLKPNGMLYVYTVNKKFILRSLYGTMFASVRDRELSRMGHDHELYYTREELSEMFKTAGFRNVKTFVLYPPLHALYDMKIYPKFLKYYLRVSSRHKITLIYFFYTHIFLPALRFFSVIDIPFILLGNSSAVVAVGEK